MNKKSIYIAGLAALTLTACKPHLDTDAPGAGNLDLKTYVAVGNSLTAGYADGTLYKSGQENAYPIILAKQFSQLGGGAFKTPFLAVDKGYPGLKRILGYTTSCKGVVSLGPVFEDTTGAAASNAANTASVATGGPYNNTGVPGIRAIDYLLPGYGALNPYSKRFFLDLAASPLAEINRASATFFTAWIGNNDVLAYATSGGVGKSSNGSFADQNSISSTSLFSIAVDSVLNRMTSNGAKGAVMNIPDVTTVPYFTTIPINGLTLSATDATALSAAYAPLGIKFTEGANNFIIQDTTAPGKFRQIRSGEYLLLTLPQDSLLCGGWGSKKPIPSQYVLDANEVGNVRTATATFNSILQQGASKRGLAYVDMNTYLKTLQTGFLFNGVGYSATFVQGGAFSLDGVHLTPRGYALAANEIIRVVNQYYNASIPQADVNSYSGIRFP